MTSTKEAASGCTGLDGVKCAIYANKSCPHSSCGVKEYNSCVHSSCGVKTYQSCWHY